MRRWLWICLAVSASAAAIHYRALPTQTIGRRIGRARRSNLDRERIFSDVFGEAGCPASQITEQPVKRTKPPNLICALPGELDSVIIVDAHFDFVDAGKGIVDNWSGASLLPSLYESLKSEPRRHTFLFTGFTDEEKGMIGSSYYVGHLTADERNKIRAMVNLDSLGTGPTKVETTRGDKRLANALAAVALTLHLPLNVMNVHQVGRSDSDSFQDRKIPAINIHSVTTETFPILHTPRDRLEAIRLEDYYDSYRLIAAYLAYLDQTLDKPESTVRLIIHPAQFRTVAEHVKTLVRGYTGR